MESWWNEIDDGIVRCLRRRGAMSPDALGREVGISEGEAIAFLSMLAREGRIRICLVEAAPAATALDAVA